MNPDQALAALIHGRIIEARPASGPADPARVTAQLGSTQYLFRLLSDGQWRWTCASTYGNDERPTGPGCDASGWVVPVAWADVLTRLIESKPNLSTHRGTATVERKCQLCDRLATQRLVVRIESGHPTKYRYDAAAYCSEHAADIVNEIAHGEPPDATLVSVVALVQTGQERCAE